MTFRPFLLPTLCAVAAMAGACDQKSVRISSTRTEDTDTQRVLKVLQTLQCPQTMGSLTRKGAASNEGTICTYSGPRGAEVSLHLVALDGESPAESLNAFETRLSKSLPEAVAQLKASAQEEASRSGATASATTGEATAAGAPGVDVGTNEDDASVRLPGLRIETKGDQSSVRIGGFHINANDAEGTVDIKGSDGGDAVSIQAHQDSAEIRTSAGGNATRASWILTDNRPSTEGWRLVGYEARGPEGGPIVVATVRSRDRDRGRVFEDAKDLVSLNVGK